MSSKINGSEAGRPTPGATPSATPAPTPTTPPTSQLPEALAPWRTPAYGDARDDIRAALSAGADTADDLFALECALITATEEPSDLDPETRQRALQSATRQLHARATLLTQVFDYLWNETSETSGRTTCLM